MSTRKKKLDPKKVHPCYDTHNTFFEGGHKVHLMNEETGRCLCGYEPMFHNEVFLDHPESPYKSTLEYVCQPDPDGNLCLRCKKILAKRIAPRQDQKNTTKMISDKQHKALVILTRHPEGITASRFAMEYFTEPEHEYLFTSVSNQGNGACAGKKAWLCAGSLLGRLAKKGLVRKLISRNRGADHFFITEKGKQTL